MRRSNRLPRVRTSAFRKGAWTRACWNSYAKTSVMMSCATGCCSKPARERLVTPRNPVRPMLEAYRPATTEMLEHRPSFIKMGRSSWLWTPARDPQRIVHTGQHYDERMSAEILTELHFPAPDVFLGVGSGPTAHRPRAPARRSSACSSTSVPALVCVGGDVNSIRAVAFAAASSGYPSLTLRRDCGRSTGRCRRRSTASSPTACPTYCSRKSRVRGQPDGGGHRPRPGAFRRQSDDRFAAPLRAGGRGAHAPGEQRPRGAGRTSS